MGGQTILITGANTGLGLEAARHIVNLSASKVILGVRTLFKGLAAAKDIESTTSRSGIVEVWEVDLESFASVKAFAARAKALKRLETAIMNAGLASQQWNLTSDGWERQLQVNVLSTTLLSLLRLPLLKQTKEAYPETTPHLVLVASDMHLDSTFPQRYAPNILNTLNSHDDWVTTSAASGVERYAVTKLLLLFVMVEHARITSVDGEKPKVVVDAVAPGFCKSELLSREEAPMILKVVQFLTARTLPVGARTLVDAAYRDLDSNGKYLDHQKVAKMAPLVVSEEASVIREQVWKEIVELLKGVAPEVGTL